MGVNIPDYMKKHADFDIWLHDDGELRGIHGADVISRTVLRCWPLSVVERVRFAGGASRIYKAYYNLPVETEFYRSVRSRHIPALHYSHSDGDRHWLLLEDVAGQHPAGLSYVSMLEIARRAQEIIGGLSTVNYVRHDLSENNYGVFAQSTIDLLLRLHNANLLAKTGGDVIEGIKTAMSHPEVLRIVHAPCPLIHGDLKCDNILIRPDGGIVIIDWQNISRGPSGVDAYSLLATQGIDPVPLAGVGPELIRLALEARWFADCLSRWMPYPSFLDGRIAAIGGYMRRIAENNGYAGEGVYYFH